MPAKKIPPPNTGEARVTKRQRIAVILRELLAGEPVGQIQREYKKKWKCSERTIRGYITECRRKIIPSWYEWSDLQAVASEMVAKLDRVYRKAIKAGDHQAAVRAIRQQAELFGLNSARMIAKERDSLAQQLAELRKGNAEQAIVPSNGAPVEQLNNIRSLYGQRRFDSVEEYNAWKAALVAQRGNGAN